MESESSVEWWFKSLWLACVGCAYIPRHGCCGGTRGVYCISQDRMSPGLMAPQSNGASRSQVTRKTRSQQELFREEDVILTWQTMRRMVCFLWVVVCRNTGIYMTRTHQPSVSIHQSSVRAHTTTIIQHSITTGPWACKPRQHMLYEQCTAMSDIHTTTDTMLRGIETREKGHPRGVV